MAFEETALLKHDIWETESARLVANKHNVHNHAPFAC